MLRKIQLFKSSKVVRTDRPLPDWILTFRRWMYTFTAIGLALLIMQSGLRWSLPPFVQQTERIIDFLIYATFLINIVINVYYTVPRSRYLPENYLDLIVLIPILFTPFTIKAGIGAIIIRHILSLLKVFTRSRKLKASAYNNSANAMMAIPAANN